MDNETQVCPITGNAYYCECDTESFDYWECHAANVVRVNKNYIVKSFNEKYKNGYIVIDMMAKKNLNPVYCYMVNEIPENSDLIVRRVGNTFHKSQTKKYNFRASVERHRKLEKEIKEYYDEQNFSSIA